MDKKIDAYDMSLWLECVECVSVTATRQSHASRSSQVVIIFKLGQSGFITIGAFSEFEGTCLKWVFDGMKNGRNCTETC